MKPPVKKTAIPIPVPIIETVNGKLWTTSLNVADVYGKRHDNVLHDIKAVMNDCPPETNLLNFQEIKYTDSRGRSYPAYRISRDGLMLLVMGYNGPKAMKHKLAYMAIFNAMEAKLKELVSAPSDAQKFLDRIDMNRRTVDPEHFCVFHEIAQMAPELLHAKVPLDEHTMPDISVGILWGKYWKDNNLDEKYGPRSQYGHVYPSYFPQAKCNPVEAWQYPLDALPAFYRWLRGSYIPTCFPRYMQGKVKGKSLPASVAQQAVEAFLGKQIAK